MLKTALSDEARATSSSSAGVNMGVVGSVTVVAVDVGDGRVPSAVEVEVGGRRVREGAAMRSDLMVS
jgi:hypothetical protein